MSGAARDIGLPAGTPVLTPAGEVPVEQLAPGDVVIAVAGGAAPFQPLVALRRTAIPAALVRLRAGALAEGSPREDLLLPPDHALLIEGVLVPAGALLGGPGVVLEQAAGIREVFAPVLAGHDAVLAAGTAVETAPPDPDAPACARRGGADAALIARLAWRAEAMGWLPPAPVEPVPAPADLAEQLASTALGPLVPPAWEPR